jgi:hypothetical protein
MIVSVRSLILTITLGEIKETISKLQIKINYCQGMVKLKLAIIRVSLLILTISLSEIRVLILTISLSEISILILTISLSEIRVLILTISLSEIRVLILTISLSYFILTHDRCNNYWYLGT